MAPGLQHEHVTPAERDTGHLREDRGLLALRGTPYDKALAVVDTQPHRLDGLEQQVHSGRRLVLVRGAQEQLVV
jgi:hypothetical protein